MNINKEQIENEIKELANEMENQLSLARQIFRDHARTQAEIGHFKRILELRNLSDRRLNIVSCLSIGFAESERAEPSSLCVVTWTGPRESPVDMRLFIKTHWRVSLPDYLISYVGDLWEDWKELLRSEPAGLIAMISQLSVGPIRSIDSIEISIERVKAMVREHLGESVQFPTDVTSISPGRLG